MPAAVQDSPNKIFIGSMPKAWTEAKMEAVFEKFGKITEVSLMKNKETGESRGFGFITFESSDDASNAIQGMKGKEIEGTQLKVDGALKSLHASNPGLRGRGGFRGGMGMGMRGMGPQSGFRGRGGPLMRGGPRGGFSGRGGPPPRGGFMPRGRGGPPSRGMGPGGEEMGRGGPPTRGMGRGSYEGASAGGARGSSRGGMRGSPRASRGAPRGAPSSSRGGRGGVGRTLLDRTPQLDVEPEPRARPLLSKEPLMTGPGLSDHRSAREPRGRPVEHERDSYRDSRDYLSLGAQRWEETRLTGPSFSERGLLPREPAAWDEPARREVEPLLREREARAPPPLERHAERPRSSFPSEREATYGSRSTSQYAEESYGRGARDDYPTSRATASYDYAEARPARSDFGAESYRRDPYGAAGSSDLHPARSTRDSLLDREFAASSRSADPYGPSAQSSLSRGYGAGREAALSRESMLPREPARSREAPLSREYGVARAVPREYGEARREESLRGDFPSVSRAGAYPEDRPAASLSARYYDDYEKPAARGYGAETYGSARDLGGSAAATRPAYSSRDPYPSGRGERAEKPGGYGDPYRSGPSAYGGRSAATDRNGSGLASRPYSRY